MEDDWSNVRDNISMFRYNEDIVKFHDDSVAMQRCAVQRGNIVNNLICKWHVHLVTSDFYPNRPQNQLGVALII